MSPNDQARISLALSSLVDMATIYASRSALEIFAARMLLQEQIPSPVVFGPRLSEAVGLWTQALISLSAQYELAKLRDEAGLSVKEAA